MVRSNKYLVLALGALTMFGAGCSGGSTGDDSGSGHDATSEGGGDSGGPAMTYTYVINALTIDPADTDMNNPTMPHTGFNLDNLCSTSMSQFGCGYGDSTSMIDTDQNTTGCTDPSGTCKCVDNQLPAVADLIGSVAPNIRGTLTDEVNQNKLALLVRVSGVNDLMNDDSVTVAVYQAFPTFTSNCNAVPTDGEYSVAMSSLNSANVDDPKVHFMGKIVNGRLQVTSGINDQFILPLPPIMGQQITLALHATQIRANLTADSGSTGNLGGFIVGQDLVTTVCTVAPSFCSAVPQLIGPEMDIDYPFPPTDDSSGCFVSMDMDPNHMGRGALSAGLGFTLVKAHVSTTTPVAASQAAGTCGASSSGGDAGAGDGG